MSDIVKEEQRRAIRDARKSLRWDVTVKREGRHGNPLAYGMASFPRERRHEVYLPPNGDGRPYDRLSELHEWAHAVLAESVDPLFGTFVMGTVFDLDAIAPVRGVINEAADWFVNGWICRRHPVAFKDRFARNAMMVEPGSVLSILARDPNPLWGLATLAEMAAGLRAFAGWDGRIADPVLASMVGKFLAADPSTPSAEAVVGLATRLLPAEWRVAVSVGRQDDGDPYWFVGPQTDLVPSLAASGRGSERMAS